MKLFSFLLFGLIPLCGFSQIDQRKLDKAVDYINWKYTDNVIQKFKKSDRKDWHSTKIKTIEDTPDRDSLEQVLTNFSSDLQNFSQLIDDRKKVLEAIHGEREIEKVFDGIPIDVTIDDEKFTIDSKTIKKANEEIFKYLALGGRSEGSDDKKLSYKVSNQIDEEIMTLKSKNFIIFWPYFAYTIFLFLLILAIGLLLLYYKTLNIRKKLLALDKRQNSPTDGPFKSTVIASPLKLTDEDKQAIKDEILAEIRQFTPQVPATFKGDSPASNALSIPYSQSYTTYYFAAPLGNGFSDQYKTEHVIADKSLYILEVDNTGLRGKFRLVNEPWLMRFAVNERQLYIDPVCKIDGKFTQQAGSVKVIKEGEATLSNGLWAVSDSQKALIRYE